LAVQSKAIVKQDLIVYLIDSSGRQIDQKTIHQGSTLCYFDTSSLYNGVYFIKIFALENSKTIKVIVAN
jgi:hypothetical protein